MVDIACKASCWGYRCFVVSKISGVCNLVTRNEPGLMNLVGGRMILALSLPTKNSSLLGRTRRDMMIGNEIGSSEREVTNVAKK